MTVLLVLVTLFLVARVRGTRKLGARHEAEVRALQARVDVLESVSGVTPAPASSPAVAEVAALRAAAAAESAPAPPRVVERDRETHLASATPREPVARPPRPATPGLGERLAAQLRTGWDQWIAQNLLAAAGGVFVLLGASFFVAVAISNGWLTPWRQVGGAVIGGALLLAAGWRAWPAVSQRAALILSQSLVGTGAGVMLLGIVAGARIYAHPLYPSWVGLLGTGAVSAVVVAIAVRRRAQVTAGLGIATAVAAPLLVDAPVTTGSIAFLLLALAASGVVIALRGWPWLLQVSIAGSLVQAAAWASNDEGEARSAVLVVAILVLWWALLALPALVFEVRADRPRLRMPTSGALFQVAGLSVLFGWLAFGSVHASGFEALLCVLAGLHLVAGAVMLRLRPSSRAGAVFVWAIGAAFAAGAAAVLLGGAVQPAFWAVETLAMLWLFVRFSDEQAGLTATLLGTLTVGWTLHLAPPESLAHPLGGLATGVVALAAVVLAFGAAAFLLRRVRDAAAVLALAAWVALVYLVGVLIVGVVAPSGIAIDQTAQLVVTGAWAVLATAACVAAIALPSRQRGAVRAVAEISLWAIAFKALALDGLALGIHEPRLLWLLASLAALAAVLVVVERRLPKSELPLPLAASLVGLLVVLGLVQPGFDAYRAGTPHLLETLAVLALGLLASALALWRYPARARADALVAAVLLVLPAALLTAVTLLTPQLGVTSELAQRAVSVAPLLLALALLGVALLSVRIPPPLRSRALECTGGLLALAAVLAVADTAEFGATGRAIAVAGCWLVAAGALSLAVRTRPAHWLLTSAAGGAVAMCAFALVTTGPARALGFGAEHGWLALAAAAIATVAAVAAAVCAPARLRTGAVGTALAVALYGASVLVVTALTQSGEHVDQAAQVALSITWTVWGVALLGAGVVLRSPLGLFLRRSGIALTGVAAAKVLLVDTARFDTAHRAAVFLALGLILLAGAAAYARLTRKLEISAAGALSGGC